MASPRATSVSTNTSVTYSSYTNLSIPPGIPSNRNGSSGGQIARFALHVTTGGSAPSVAAGTALRFVCRDADRVYWVKDATISFASTIPRAGLDGASGDYVAQLTFPESSSDKLDLLGSTNSDANPLNDTTWYVGLVGTTVTNATGLTVYTTWSDQV